jgi:putative lipoprotein
MPPRSAHAALVVLLTLTIPSQTLAARSARITGTATYRERVSLTRDAVFDAELVEVARAGARGEVIANVHKANPGQVPIAFEIRYNAGRISAHHHLVRATITRATNCASQHWNPSVLARGHGSKVASSCAPQLAAAVSTRRIPGSRTTAGARSRSATRW